MILMLIVVLLALGGSFGLVWWYLQKVKSKGVADLSVQRDELLEDITKIAGELEELLKYTASYASKGQFDSLSSQVDQTKTDLEKEKANLQEIEGKLESLQKTVEEKETAQQDLKTAKEEDEIKLEELLTRYQDISDEAVGLEQKLAESMRNLDTMLEELNLTADQKAVLEDLSSALSTAGESLRNLLIEYQTVKERLDLLIEQHEDLEEEYTRLVEQQLGE